MNITERKASHDYLERLKEPGDLPLDVWSDLVEEAIRITFPPESPIHDRVKALRTPVAPSSAREMSTAGSSETPGTANSAASGSIPDPRLTAYPPYLAAAQVYLGRPQPDTRDESLERQVLSIIDAKLFETRIVQLAKWVVTFVVPAIVALVIGGTVWGGFQVNGVVKSIKDKFDKDVQDVEDSRKKALERIMTRLGDDTQGVLGDLRTERDRAVDKIGKTLGAADLKGTVLGQLDEQKVAAVTAIATALGDESKRSGALGAIRTGQAEALKRLDEQLMSSEKELRAQAPKRLESFAARTADIQTRLERLEPAADRVLKAQAILSETSGVISPQAVLTLLHWQLVAVIVVGLLGGFAGALLASRFRR